jgi:hypothetical protein
MDYGGILVYPVTVPGTHLMIKHENPASLTDTYVALGCYSRLRHEFKAERNHPRASEELS